MPCAHQSRNGMCVASCSSLSFAVSLSSLLFLLLLLLHFLLLLRLSSHPHLLPDRSTLAPHNFLHSQCCAESLVLKVCSWHSNHSLSLPAENRTSFIETHPHVHGAHSAVHVQLDDCVVSIVFECADCSHPTPRHCQLARPFSLRSKASQRLRS